MSAQENNDQTVVTVVVAFIIVAILAGVIGFAVFKSRAKPAPVAVVAPADAPAVEAAPAVAPAASAAQ